VNDVDVPQNVADLARELLDELDESLCAFWACPGPDVEPVAMATCRVCSTIHRLRSLTGQAPR
jgi:hypothetical protein